MRQRPGAQEEEELEVALRLGVLVAIDYHDAAAPAGGCPRIPEHRDKIVHELEWGQKDFLRHYPLIACGAALGHIPKAGPGYLSVGFPLVTSNE